MTSAPGLKVVQEAILADLDRLLDEGRALLAAVKEVPNRNTPYQTFRVVEERQARAWKAAGAELLFRLAPALSSCRALGGRFQAPGNAERDLKGLVGDLEGIREAVAHGALIPLIDQVAHAIAGDYLGQATAILEEPDYPDFGHAAAAVLAGAVLERHLRDLCVSRNWPITRPDKRGEQVPLTLAGLIAVVQKEQLISPAQGDELNSWAKIRNQAAHGESDQFNHEAIRRMIGGINQFLIDHLSSTKKADDAPST